jgi:hypothetical protein
MNSYINNYQYEITDRLGVLQVFPLGEADFTIEWTRQNDLQRYYKKELPNKLKFVGQAYKRLMKLETSIYRCEPLTITVKRDCGDSDGPNFIPWFSGVILLNNGNFNRSAEVIDIQLTNVQLYDCYENNKDAELNMLSISYNPVTVRLFPDLSIEKITKYDQSTKPAASPCADYVWDEGGQPGDKGWIYYYHSYTYNGNFSSSNCTRETRYAREVMLLPCGSAAPGGAWIFIGTNSTQISCFDKYARPVSKFNCVLTFPETGPNITSATESCQIYGEASSQTVVDNGRFLSDILPAFVDSFCNQMVVKSEFFQINPDTPTTINYVTGERSKTDCLVLFQKSDVKRPNVTGNATTANLTFEKLIKALCGFYNCVWRMETVNGLNILRIEHVSYFVPGVGIDLTQARYAKYLVGIDQYSYENSKIASREEFKAMEQGYGDFTGFPIRYNSGCVTKDVKESVITHTVESFTVDVGLCLANPNPDSAIVDDEGFVLMACRQQGDYYYCLSEPGIIGGVAINNTLAWSMLHRDYWRWERLLKTGVMNGQETTFFSVVPTKKGKQITVPLCCGDNFNPDELVRTPFGDAVVNKATFQFKTKMITIEPLYDANANLISNLAPTAVNKAVSTYQNQSITIDMFSGNSDPDGTLTGIVILNPPLHGGLIVNSNSVVYNPIPGYVGDDYFNYAVLDDWNERSNTAMVSIIVKALNTAPVAGDRNYSTNKNVAVTVPAPGAFGASSDDNGFTLQSHTNPAHGVLVFNNDGSFTYTPSGDYIGPDSFDFTIVDDQGLTDTGTVSLNVLNADLPVAVNDTYAAPKDGVLNVTGEFGLLANDTTQTGTLSAITVTAAATNNGGQININSDGSFSYTPPASYTGQDSYTYTITNGIDTDTAEVVFTVINKFYVDIIKQNDTQSIELASCEGEPTNNGSYNRRADFIVRFWTDAAKTNPFDTTGLGIWVNIQRSIQTSTGVGAGPTTPSVSILRVAATGTTKVFATAASEMYERELYDCSNNRVRYERTAWDIAPGELYN